MKYRTLGKTSLQVSELGFGCMSLGQDDASNAALIKEAVDDGINLFDTADLYQFGQNESSLGKALKNIRNKVLIATKVGNQWNNNKDGWEWKPGKEYILKAVEESLKRLDTDHIDLYQLHGGTLEDPIDEILEAFEILVKNGKIRYYGISSIRPNVIREYVKRSDIGSMMTQYSLLDKRPEEEILDLVSQNNIGVLARGSLAQGMLVNKPPREYLGKNAEEVKGILHKIAQLAGADKSMLESALFYVLSNHAISSCVVGIRTKEQLQELVQAMTHVIPDKKLYQLLKEQIPHHVYEQHR